MNKKILVIDDNRLDFELLEKVLSSYDYELVYNEGNESNVMKVIEDEKPGCILLDLNLNLFSGLDILKEIRANDPQKSIPVAMLTAERNPEAIIQCMKNGADDYLIKGRIEKERVIVVLNHLIDKCSLHKKLKQLEELLPICAWCKKIQEEGTDPKKESSWIDIESYLKNHGSPDLTHGICPSCKAKNLKKYNK